MAGPIPPKPLPLLSSAREVAKPTPPPLIFQDRAFIPSTLPNDIPLPLQNSFNTAPLPTAPSPGVDKYPPVLPKPPEP